MKRDGCQQKKKTICDYVIHDFKDSLVSMYLQSEEMTGADAEISAVVYFDKKKNKASMPRKYYNVYGKKMAFKIKTTYGIAGGLIHTHPILFRADHALFSNPTFSAEDKKLAAGFGWSCVLYRRAAEIRLHCLFKDKSFKDKYCDQKISDTKPSYALKKRWGL